MVISLDSSRPTACVYLLDPSTSTTIASNTQRIVSCRSLRAANVYRIFSFQFLRRIRFHFSSVPYRFASPIQVGRIALDVSSVFSRCPVCECFHLCLPFDFYWEELRKLIRTQRVPECFTIEFVHLAEWRRTEEWSGGAWSARVSLSAWAVSVNRWAKSGGIIFLSWEIKIRWVLDERNMRWEKTVGIVERDCTSWWGFIARNDQIYRWKITFTYSSQTFIRIHIHTFQFYLFLIDIVSSFHFFFSDQEESYLAIPFFHSISYTKSINAEKLYLLVRWKPLPTSSSIN